MPVESILSETYPRFDYDYQSSLISPACSAWKSPILFSTWHRPSVDWSGYDRMIEKLGVTTEEIEATIDFSGFVADMVGNLWSMRDISHTYATQDSTSIRTRRRRAEMVEFIQRLLIFTDIPSTVVLVGMNYLYRLRNSSIFAENPAFGSEYRVLVVALLAASKYVEDQSYNNQSWSEVSGFDIDELNSMEREFLEELDWKLWISPEEYEEWLGGIDHWLAKEEWENESNISTELELETETESELESECDEWPVLLDLDPLEAECGKLSQLTLDQELRLNSIDSRLTWT
ncbi:hypothetical protein K7432_011817 [Basidiobolus ranarum]|uniref:Cyclin n=1 Tax=Basidiobolus ranarum TaxID=34480 RepID=A0ABR2VU42_9FUNG